ncbi:hypothetical protein IQ250_02360 [Pseudanabaenaceae cyanobacterium LEGE 13415]|nr:hypothetical protein [Pseudanabaenaceae cyanobacterium LEGE 13415]
MDKNLIVSLPSMPTKLADGLGLRDVLLYTEIRPKRGSSASGINSWIRLTAVADQNSGMNLVCQPFAMLVGSLS